MHTEKYEYGVLIILFFYLAPVASVGVAAYSIGRITFVQTCVAVFLQMAVTTVYLCICSKFWIMDMSNAASLLIKIPIAGALFAWMWYADLPMSTIILFGIVNAILINTAVLILVGILDLASYVSNK